MELIKWDQIICEFYERGDSFSPASMVEKISFAMAVKELVCIEPSFVSNVILADRMSEPFFEACELLPYVVSAEEMDDSELINLHGMGFFTVMYEMDLPAQIEELPKWFSDEFNALYEEYQCKAKVWLDDFVLDNATQQFELIFRQLDDDGLGNHDWITGCDFQEMLEILYGFSELITRLHETYC